MNTPPEAWKAPNSEKGQTLALVTVMMLGLLGFTALAVDVGYFYVTRNELQNVADGSALAGTRTLGHTYQGLSYSEQQGYVCGDACAATIRTAAEEVAESNRAGGATMSVRVEDVAIGQWDGETFTETSTEPDAVQVIARRDEVANGPITTFFGRLLGAIGHGASPQLLGIRTCLTVNNARPAPLVT